MEENKLTQFPASKPESTHRFCSLGFFHGCMDKTVNINIDIFII